MLNGYIKAASTMNMSASMIFAIGPATAILPFISSGTSSG